MKKYSFSCSVFILVIQFVLINEVEGVERIPYSKGKETYVSEVLIRFTPGRWNRRDDQPGPYQVSFKEENVLTGPNSLAIDRRGNIYILDTGNCRILKYDCEGKFLRSVAIDAGKGRSAIDFCVGKDGDIFVLEPNPETSQYRDYLDIHNSQCGKIPYEIRHYDHQGKFISKACFPFTKEWIKETGIFPGKIYIDNAGNLYLGSHKNVCRIGLQAGKIDLFEPKEIMNGLPFTDDSTTSFYFAGPKSDKSTFVVQKMNQKGEEIVNLSIAKSEDMDDIEFLGEDQDGYIYLLLTRHEWVGAGGYFKDLQKIDRNGNQVTIIQNFPLSTFYDATRNFTIDTKGNIYFFSGSKEEARLIKWIR